MDPKQDRNQNPGPDPDQQPGSHAGRCHSAANPAAGGNGRLSPSGAADQLPAPDTDVDREIDARVRELVRASMLDELPAGLADRVFSASVEHLPVRVPHLRLAGTERQPDRRLAASTSVLASLLPSRVAMAASLLLVGSLGLWFAQLPWSQINQPTIVMNDRAETGADAMTARAASLVSETDRLLFESSDHGSDRVRHLVETDDLSMGDLVAELSAIEAMMAVIDGGTNR